MIKPALLILVPALAFPILSYHTIAGDGSANAALTSGAAVAPPVPEAPNLDLREEATYSAILERPLFSPSRRPVGPAAAPSAAQSPGGLALLGVVAGAGRTVALIRTGEGSPATKAQAGQEVSGWQVTGIAPTEVVLERQGSRLELELPFKAPAPMPVIAPEAATSPSAEAEPEEEDEPADAQIEG